MAASWKANERKLLVTAQVGALAAVPGWHWRMDLNTAPTLRHLTGPHMPAISAILVFHRDTPFLRPAIAAALNQTFRDFELLLIDNCTGIPLETLGEAARDPRVRLLRRPVNDGIFGGHNLGVAEARAELLALFDSDDLASPRRLECQIAALQADTGLGLISAMAERIDAEGRSLGQREFCLCDPREQKAYAQYAAPIVTPVTMGRREIFTALPYRKEFPFACDLDFQARVSERARLGVLPEVLLQYRWYPAQTTQHHFSELEQSRCVIQLATARRRAGRAENLPEAFGRTKGTTVADTWRRGAAVCLEENFFELSAFQARRSFALHRSPGSGCAAMRLGLRAWRKAPAANRPAVARMFFTGPVKALRLHPA